jgi:hypothetical protein
LKAWDIEEFVAKQISEWDGEQELARVCRDDWPAKRRALPLLQSVRNTQKLIAITGPSKIKPVS